MPNEDNSQQKPVNVHVHTAKKKSWIWKFILLALVFSTGAVAMNMYMNDGTLEIQGYQVKMTADGLRWTGPKPALAKAHTAPPEAPPAVEPPETAVAAPAEPPETAVTTPPEAPPAVEPPEVAITNPPEAPPAVEPPETAVTTPPETPPMVETVKPMSVAFTDLFTEAVSDQVVRLRMMYIPQEYFKLQYDDRVLLEQKVEKAYFGLEVAAWGHFQDRNDYGLADIKEYFDKEKPFSKVLDSSLAEVRGEA